jgi:large conductance mechanosensitive channel
MLKELKEFTLRRDLIAVAAGLVVASATVYLAQAIVTYLIAPVIAIFVGDSIFALNSFTIGGSEFRYGAVIEAAFTFVLALTGIYFLLVVPYRGFQGRNGLSAPIRACPECTSPISALAKRCPYCTAVVQSGLA